jgi:hypothetical protein
MFETTCDFHADARHGRLEDRLMLDIVLSLTGMGHPLPSGRLMHDFHKLTPKQRNYICCVLLERDQDPQSWEQLWIELNQTGAQ